MKVGYRVLSWTFQLVIVAIPVAAFGWLLAQELVPSGTFVVNHAVGERSPFIDRLLPDARVPDGRTIVDEPVTFFAHPHRAFDVIDVDVRFRNQGAGIVELGALAADGRSYDLRPLENSLIDGSPWHRLDADDLVLLQRTPRYASIADFLVNLPPRHEIATSHFTLPTPYRIPGYRASDQTRVIDATLRGFHAFKTYVADETLAFSFAFMDMNRDEGADPVSVVVTDEGGKQVATTSIGDDGDVSALARPSSMRSLDLSVPGLPEGAYKVELRAGRDVFFRRITTTQQKLVFLNDVFLGDEVAYKEPARPVRFWTEAKHLSFSTTHAEAVQDLQIGSATVAIPAPYAKVDASVSEDGVVRVTAPVGDVLVEGDGHVAFSPESFFNPDPVRLDWNTDIDRLGVNFVIAAYESPRREGEWTVAHASFDARALAFEQGAWKFVFSVPGVKALGASVEVDRIDMAWRRRAFHWEDLAYVIQRKLGL
ncbi:hypothetical protein EPO34_00145 [Patescibacteria group bacterium]|nr:MAG: hypothetical protein EPO34_00145 [Patescibacteria group bacterium]